MTTQTKSIVLKTAVPGPVSQQLMADKERLIANAFSIHVPAAIKEARNALVTDVDGNVFIDLA